jgi:predicted amidohydrolase YtcJ
MSTPHLAPEHDLRDLVALASSGEHALPAVVPYLGRLVVDERDAKELVTRLGVPLAGLAGDLCVDGSVGSRTAAWHAPYADAPATAGHLYLSVEQIRDHVAACTRAGLQAGFHVIGDAAVDAARRGIRRAAEQVGIAAVRAAGHRLEHVEAIDREGLLDLADLRVTACVQPAFDALWGGDAGSYAARVGVRRALAMNPFGSLAAAAVPLALGSDSPVTPLDPWGAVRSCVRHHVPEQRLDVDTAFAAHTVGGHRAARRPAGAGLLRAGSPADFAAWDLGGPPARDGSLPAMDDGGPLPRCVLTVGGGRVLHDALSRRGPGRSRTVPW